MPFCYKFIYTLKQDLLYQNTYLSGKKCCQVTQLLSYNTLVLETIKSHSVVE